MKKQNLVKRIFRNVLRYPWAYTGIFMFIVIAVVLQVVLPEYVKGVDAEDRVDVFFLSLIGALFVWVILGLIGVVIRKDCITYTNAYGVLYLLRVSPAGKVLEIGKTMWGKKGIYKVIKPSSSKYDKERHKTIGFTTHTEIVSKHRNSETVIPATVEILTDGNYNPQELYNKMLLPVNVLTDTVKIDDFVQNLLLASAEVNKETIDQWAKKYAEKRISAAQLLEGIIEVLEFPERALKNFKDVKVCLGNPIARACKGATCERV